MIDDIDNKLDDINRDNKFNDTNLVAVNIEKISKNQSITYSYFNKSFFTLFFILVFIKVDIINLDM